MKIYSILSHPNVNSLNGELFNTANNFFQTAGHSVETLNLFEVTDQLLSSANILYNRQLSSSNVTSQSAYAHNWLIAKSENLISDFIQDEIKKIKECDVLYIQTPIWLYNMPAMLKFYIEQTFLLNEIFILQNANTETDYQIIPLTQNKKVILSITTGGSEHMVTHVTGGVKELLNPFRSIFEFVGFEFIEPHITWGTVKGLDKDNNNYAKDFENYLTKLHIL